jgi:hypothetical protein
MARRKDRTRSSKNTGSPRVPNRTTATLGPQPNLGVAQSHDSTEVEPEALVVSHWIDPGEAGETFPVTQAARACSSRRASVPTSS